MEKIQKQGSVSKPVGVYETAKLTIRVRNILRKKYQEFLAERAKSKPKAYYGYLQTRKLIR